MDYKNPFNIARDFSPTPGLRYKRLSDHSAEELRDDYLAPLLTEATARNERLVVDLDGVAGYTATFLEEAFGGLVRKLKAERRESALDFFITICSDKSYVQNAIHDFMTAAIHQPCS